MTHRAARPPTGGPAIDPWPLVRRRVVELAAVPGRLLVVTDFDGTVAATSLDPMAARIEPLARSALRRLAGIAAGQPRRLHVAVLSGRTAHDVVARVRVGGIEYHGDHGLQAGFLRRRVAAERLAVTSDPALAPLVDGARALALAVSTALGRPDWLFVEEKGPSVAFHFRAAPDTDVAAGLVGAAVEAALEAAPRGRDGQALFVRFHGRRIVELRPTGADGKGATMARLLASGSFDAALVLGDDRSDAEAFGAVRDARAEGRLAGSLTVAVRGSVETPPELAAAADLMVAGPHDAARVLAALARALGNGVPRRRSA
ncbi:MAG: trehalose-phosphatase [Chloroflexota bacterium]